MYLARTTLGLVDLAFTRRYVDGADARAGELDLALLPDGENPSPGLLRVIADFAPGAALAEMHQVHGADVAVAEPGRIPDCDALVTDRPDVVLVVRVADCVPVLLADPEAGVVAAVHAGRAGVATGVVPATVDRMRTLGAIDVHAWVGPHVCGGCYEVPAALQQQVGEQVPETVCRTTAGTPGLDLGAGVRGQLAAADVTVLAEPFAEVCTLESPQLWSHRRDGETGRLAGLVRRCR